MEIIYFASDRPGGAGGMDIWYFMRTQNGEIKGPMPLKGPVNTIGDEITPFFDDSAKTLYSLFHCLDVKTGKAHWTYDMLSASWASPLIVEGRVYISDEDGDISIFGLSADPHVAMKEMKKKDGSVFMKDGKPDLFPLNGELSEIGMVEVNNSGGAVFTTPIVANNMLFIANRNQLFCIKPGTKSKVEKPMPAFSAESD